MIKKIFFGLYATACAILFAWLVFSFLDIVTDNNRPQPEHSNYNIVNVLEGAQH